MRFLVTGSAGFVGFHVAKRLAGGGHSVCGVDGLTAYYDVALKRARLAVLGRSGNVTQHELMLEDKDRLDALFAAFAPDIVIHLAAQAGVRHSLTHPDDYVGANLIGTFNVLEAARRHPPKHLLIGSTSSVYGANAVLPFSENDRTDHPLTFYAATKKSAEAMAHSYAHIWGIPTTVVRIFTAYGPWGRPDMALFKFTDAILSGRPIEIYNNGDLARDFTYIDDLVHALTLLADIIPQSGGADKSPAAPYRVVNVGSGTPVKLMDFVAAIEQATGRTAERRYLPMQQGDLHTSWADTRLLERLTQFRPATPVAQGVARFVAWYREYYKF
jgi:UDP-glucuronate 4-epimerase